MKKYVDLIVPSLVDSKLYFREGVYLGFITSIQ
jgi:hypothetical protein